MQHFSISPFEMMASPWRHRDLVRVLVKREVLGRYRGSVLGILWSFFNPVFMLAVYTFVFSVVFRARWSEAGDESRAKFALILFAGLLIFNLFAECLNRAPTLILNNVNFVKKIVFPLEILPWVAFGTALFHALISFGVWLLFSLAVIGPPMLTVLWLPLLLLPLLLLTLGLSWLLAALGVFLRDVAQMVGIVTTTLMFLSPIFYPLAAIPERYQPLILCNPLTLIIEQARGVLIFDTPPVWSGWTVLTVVAALVAWLGFALFQKTRKGFADVL
ncbi:MAG: ABC transporter permease [Desulfuromonadales bacterium]|nr:ABC transporter permease [Desulfuromonadales bacterium]